MADSLDIAAVTRLTGLTARALRFYEAQGLIHGARTSGRHRQYPRHVLRRVSFIRAAQHVGLSLDDIRQALSGLPDARTLRTMPNGMQVAQVRGDEVRGEVPHPEEEVQLGRRIARKLCGAVDRAGNFCVS